MSFFRFLPVAGGALQVILPRAEATPLPSSRSLKVFRHDQFSWLKLFINTRTTMIATVNTIIGWFVTTRKISSIRPPSGE